MAHISARDRRQKVQGLLDAALEGDLATVEGLLDTGVPLEARDEGGHTALSEAAVGGQAAMVEALLTRGADVHALNKEQRTPLHRAAFHGYTEVVELLLSCGADPKVKDKGGDTALTLANNAATVKALEGPAPARKFEFKPAVRAAAEPERAGDTSPEEAPEPEAAAEVVEEPVVKKKIYRYLVVSGSGEKRLNGAYAYQKHTADDRWVHVKDENCFICYVHHKQEWRLCITNYKRGNTLYRLMERRDTGVRAEYSEDDAPMMAKAAPEPPESGEWLVWFGATPAPQVLGTSELTPEDFEEPEAEVAKAEADESADAPSETVVEKPESPKATKMEIVETEGTDEVETGVRLPKREFLEVSNSLQIVAEKDVAASQPAAKAVEVVGGPRIVETADGLFAPEELQGDEEEVDTWYPEADPVEPEWDAVMIAKQKAADLFAAGEFEESVRVFTGCLLVLPTLETAPDTGEPPIDDFDEVGATGRIVEISTRQLRAEEVRQLTAALRSNRALVCLKLKHWEFAVRDCDAALALDPRLFKAYYRRAFALKELGRLDRALADASKVCEHYQTQPAPNPEAWDLRESIIAMVRKEKTKWKSGKVGARWNKSTLTRKDDDEDLKPKPKARPLPKSFGAPTQPPRNYGDLERHLLHFRRHGGSAGYAAKLTPAVLKTSRWGPDAFGTFLKVLAESDDDAHVAALLLAGTPDVLTWQMLEDSERECAQKLLSRVEGKGDFSTWKQLI